MRRVIETVSDFLQPAESRHADIKILSMRLGATLFLPFRNQIAEKIFFLLSFHNLIVYFQHAAPFLSFDMLLRYNCSQMG